VLFQLAAQQLLELLPVMLQLRAVQGLLLIELAGQQLVLLLLANQQGWCPPAWSNEKSRLKDKKEKILYIIYNI